MGERPAVLAPFPQPLVPAIIVRRANRFAVEVDVGGRQAAAYLPNSGRLPELILPGTPALLVPVDSTTCRGVPRRRTAYDLLLVQPRDTLVCVDTRVPNALVANALRERALPEFAGYGEVRPEFAYGHSRLDFRFRGGGLPDCLVEVKSVTLVRDGVGLFPDAPTERGRRHLVELMQAVRSGLRAVIIFIAQRGDAHSFAPNDTTDPAFGESLRTAVAEGVEAYVYGCDVNPEGIQLRGELRIGM